MILSGLGAPATSGRRPASPASLSKPYGPIGPPTLFTGYPTTCGLSHEQLAMVSDVQREWAAQNPARHLQGADHGRGCAEFADDRLPLPPIAVLPGDRRRRRLDPGCRGTRPRLPAQLVLAANRGPVYLLGTGESVEPPMVSPPVIPAKAGIQDPEIFEQLLRPSLSRG
jgi:hypothetical protein